MRRLIRLSAAAALVASGVALAVVGPAFAAPPSAVPPPPGPKVTINPVNGGKPITSGAGFTVTGTATPDGGWDLQSVGVSITGPDRKSLDLTVNGMSQFTAQTPTLNRNGPYAVNVTAIEKPKLVGPCGLCAEHSNTADANVAVVVPPAAVSGLKLLPPDPTGRAVTLKWDANPEPDIVEYLVYRQAPGDKQASVIVATGLTTATDLQPPAAGGKMAYSVAAVRAGASGRTDLQSCGANLVNCVVGGQAKAQFADVPVDAAALALAKTPNTLANGAPAAIPNLAANGPAAPLPIIPGINLNGPMSPGAGPPPTLADGTFAPALPFQPGSENDKEDGPPDGAASNLARSTDGLAGRSRPFLLWLAAALLVFVVAMHLLWLRREVNRRSTDGLVPLPAGGERKDEHVGPVPVGATDGLPAWSAPHSNVWSAEPSAEHGAPVADDADRADPGLPPTSGARGGDDGDLPPFADDQRPSFAPGHDESRPAVNRLLVSIGGRRPG